MFNTSAVQTCLRGLVGFFQADDPAYPYLESDLAASSSGLYVQGVHPLVTIENIVNISPEFASFDYPVWDANTAYVTGRRAKLHNKIYQALAPSTNVQPPGGANWIIVDPLSEWLRRIYKEACSNLALTIQRQKKLETAGKSLLESQALYSGYGQLIDKIIKRSRFVGFEINTTAADGLAVAISRFAIQLDTAQSFNLYLYNSSQDRPVSIFPITIARGNSFAWQDLTDAIISYTRGGADVGSSWYLGYYEDDLQGQAIKKTHNFSHAPCQSCNSFDVNAYNLWSQYVNIRPISVDEIYLKEDKTIWDGTGTRYYDDNNWGINLSLTVSCDITDIFCRNKSIIANALRMQIAVDLLQYIGFTTRIGVIAETTKKLARAELSTKTGSGSFMMIYLDEVKAANIDFQGLNSMCMPCNPTNRVQKRTI